MATGTGPGDVLTLEYDQRYAIEKDYDYGYVDVSSEADSVWVTLASFDNPGFAGTPGTSTDWDHETYGHWSLDMSAYAGASVTVRFRLESDGANSSQDTPDNSPMHSFKDGAWQLDNFDLSVNDTVRWFDDCESPGSNGWTHEDIPTMGQVGVVFERVYRPDTFRHCRLPGWWMAAVDSITGRVVDGQASWLVSPPIDISGADVLIGQYDFWKDCPVGSHDLRGIWHATADSAHCVTDLDAFENHNPGGYPANPMYGTWTDNWNYLAGNDWMAICWRLWNDSPAQPGYPHMTGLMLGRQRVGVPIGGSRAEWRYDRWSRFDDTYHIEDALVDTARIKIQDSDDVVSALLVVSSDGGQTWEASAMIRQYPYNYYYWLAPPPVDHIAPATEIWYYFEATDGAGDLHTHPSNAPDSYYEFSVLPIEGSIEDPAILLIDKCYRMIPGADGSYRHTNEHYFRESLDILGFEYDVFDAPIARTGDFGYRWNGPDTSAMEYYDTQIWFTGESGWQTVT
ncbi:immune inhibitor A, partial [bacterium]|nr:immune inhibitor A [bacterium]